MSPERNRQTSDSSDLQIRQSPYTMIDTEMQRPMFKGIDLENDRELGMKLRDILN
jgi:hypothetical protein